MGRFSLKLRSFAAALLAMLLFIPLTTLALEQAFANSLTQSILERLKIQNLNLLSAFEFEQAQPQMPDFLYNEELNIPGSGLYAYVLYQDSRVWQSHSTLSLEFNPKFSTPALGEEHFEQEFGQSNNFFMFAFTAEFPTAEGYQPVSFILLQDKSGFFNEIRTFRKTLWYWLGFVALVLLSLLLLSLSAALLPINNLIEQIKLAEQGKLARIHQDYPPELEKLKASLNHLLDVEQQQRQRYKNSLSDLAHSLKTPLAVISGSPNLPPSIQEPVHQINSIIQRQLKRAVKIKGSGWEQAEPVQPTIDMLLSAMRKVYADKHLDIQALSHPEHLFQGDKTDLMELLGNLLDNACKAAQTRVRVSSEMLNRKLILTVEDDGPGVPPDAKQTLLERGQRLDSYKDGQGIGMAVVADLVAAYSGKLDIVHSNELGGAKFMVSF